MVSISKTSIANVVSGFVVVAGVVGLFAGFEGINSETGMVIIGSAIGFLFGANIPRGNGTHAPV